ncbi:Histidine kinase [Salegentibacter agarivorans]|uniref:Histidine kinase n=2 Tax=Flavobacteriaceae TaxID=49546 RepID=A0A1I2KYI4_9FLAO|nr:Histidine kinase [Salegentibacter agarivorans]
MTKKKEVLFHALFWLLFVYFELIQFDLTNPYLFSIRKLDIFEISGGIIFLATFYINYILLLPWVFDKLNWKRGILSIASGYIFFISLRYFLEQILISQLIGHGNYFEGTSLSYYVYDNLYYGSFPLIISSILWILIFNVRLLEYNKHIVEEKSATEVKFLKAQLNPHFMFNTLNNIYSLVYFKSDKALPAIEKLGELMRYTTYETSKEKIDLQQEVNYIKSYIELDQLRHEDDNTVNFEIAIDKPFIQIPPFLLSPLVENALKHGKYNKYHPIFINLQQTGERLFFKITNKIGHQKKDKLGGIGLDNLKKTLVINYPDAHSLKINQDKQIFSAQLEIDLDGKAN